MRGEIASTEIRLSPGVYWYWWHSHATKDHTRLYNPDNGKQVKVKPVHCAYVVNIETEEFIFINFVQFDKKRPRCFDLISVDQGYFYEVTPPLPLRCKGERYTPVDKKPMRAETFKEALFIAKLRFVPHLLRETC